MSETPAPAVKVEIAFDSNFSTPAASRTWTDVSAHQYGDVTVTWGRGDRLSQIEPSGCTVVLDNTDGRFTAGNTSSPYYPNVKLDRPIRITVTPAGGTASVRFTGYVNGWPVEWPFGVDTAARVAISATSRTGRLGLRNALHAMVTEDAINTSAAAIYPLSDPSGSLTAEDVSGNDASPLQIAGAGDDLSFGGSGVEFAPGKHLASGDSALDLAADPPFTFAATFTTTTAQTAQRLWGAIYLTAAQLGPYADGRPHRAIVSRATGGTVTAEIDGTALSGYTLTGTAVPFIAGLNYAGTLRDLVYWSTTLTAGDRTDDYTAFNGGFGETSDAALSRIAGYAGIPSAEVNADAGAVVMGGVDTTGMATADALRVIESTEGGVLIDDRNGDLRLIGRRARYGSTAEITLSMADEEVAADYSPTLDRSLLRNDMTGTNAASSVGSVDTGAAVSLRAVDATSSAEYGTAGGSVEVAAADPSEAYAAASWIVANLGEPSPRVPNLTVDLLPLSLTRMTAVLGVFAGDRVAITGRPSQDSSSSAEFFVEGGTETWSARSAVVSWNVSPIGLEDSVVVIDDAVKGQIDAGNYIGY